MPRENYADHGQGSIAVPDTAFAEFHYQCASCALNASLCSRTSGGIPTRLSIATTSNRHGHSLTCRSPRNRMRRSHHDPLLFGRRRSTPASPADLHRAPFACALQRMPASRRHNRSDRFRPLRARGTKFRAMNTYPATANTNTRKSRRALPPAAPHFASRSPTLPLVHVTRASSRASARSPRNPFRAAHAPPQK